MNITDNLIRIKEGKEGIISSLKRKGVSIADNTLINEIPTIIDNAEIGGGGGSDTPVQPEIPELTAKYLGASVFRISVPEDNYLAYIGLKNDSLNPSCIYNVDWGDSTNVDENCKGDTYHIYEKKGVYDINLFNLNQQITLSNYSYQYISIFNTTYNDNITYNYSPSFNSVDYNDTSLFITDILIGENITSLGESCFQNCKQLKTINILEGVKSLGSNCFKDCQQLTHIKIPQSVTSFGNYVFHCCYQLRSVELPNAIYNFGTGVFLNCSTIKNIQIKSLSSLSNQVFDGCNSLENITLPKNISTLDSNTFNNCYLLRTFDFSNISNIKGSFSGCYSLENLTIPNSQTEINHSFAKDCKSLTTINLHESITQISGDAFSGCTSLLSLTIPQKVKSLPDNLCRNCQSLQYVVIPENVTSIGNYAFQNCYSLNTIYIKSITAPSISSSTFTNIGIRVPSNIQKKLYIPEGSTGYESWLEYLQGFEISYLEPTLETIDYSTDIIYKLEEKQPNFNFSKGFYYRPIYDNQEEYWRLPINYTNDLPMFSGGTQFKEIVIPENVSEIIKHNFSNCIKLTNIDIPSTIQSIGDYAFYNCYKLSTITCKSIIPPTIQSNTFQYVGSKVSSGTKKVLRVPEGSDYSTWKSKLSGFTIEYIPLSEL